MNEQCPKDMCPLTKAEAIKMKETVEALNHKIFGGDSPETSLVTVVAQIKHGMDCFNKNANRFMSIFGVLIIMVIFNSGMFWNQQRENNRTVENNSEQIQHLHTQIENVRDIKLEGIWQNSTN